MKKTFIFYNDRKDYTEEMSREEKGLFLECILDYQNGVDPDAGSIKFVWSRVKKQLDEDNEKRLEEIEKRRTAGRLGGLAKSSITKHVLAGAKECLANLADNVNVTVNDNVNDNINVNDNYKEEETAIAVPVKKKSIINKHNKDTAVAVYDKIKDMCVVVDGSLDDCVVLYSKLAKYGSDPVSLLEIMITKMRDTGLSKFYSCSSPGKLSDNIGTIVEKLKAESDKIKSKKRVF